VSSRRAKAKYMTAYPHIVKNQKQRNEHMWNHSQIFLNEIKNFNGK
jgi:hypothetical protein